MMPKFFLTTVFVLILGSQVDSRSPTKALRERVLTFLSLFNGDFSDIVEVREQVKFGDNVVFGPVNVTIKPVHIAALDESPTVYFEQSYNNKLVRMHIILVSEDAEGIIHLIPLNFTDPSQHAPHTFDPTTIENLALSDFTFPPEDCLVTFTQVEENVFMGHWPDCRSEDPSGAHPAYTMTMACNSFDVIVTSHLSEEASGQVPYKQPKYASYPLLPEWLMGADSFTDPCEV